MSTMTAMGTRAQAAIADALMTRDDSYASGELTIVTANAATVRELLDAIGGFEVVTWRADVDGVDTAFRSYRGVLPCGLALDVITERDRVPHI